jgi:hypothetical protein
MKSTTFLCSCSIVRTLSNHRFRLAISSKQKQKLYLFMYVMISPARAQSDPIDGQFLELIFARYEIIYANPRSVRGGRGFNITYIHI